MEKALQLVFSQQVRDVTGEGQLRKVPSLRPACVEAPAALPATLDSSARHGLAIRTTTTTVATATGTKAGVSGGVPNRVLRSFEESCPLYNSNKATLTPPSSAPRSTGLLGAPETFIDVVSPQNSPSVLTTGASRRPKLAGSSSSGALNTAGTSALCGGATNAAPSTTAAAAPTNLYVDPAIAPARQAPLLKSLAETQDIMLPNLIAYDGASRCSCSPALLGVSDSSEGFDSAADGDAERKRLLSDSGDSKEEKAAFFKTKPRLGEFTTLIEWLLHCGEAGEITPPTTVREDGTEAPSTLLSEDTITKLCTAATQVLAKEPTLLELEVDVADTLVVVGDIHGQFQDLYTSVLCQQYDRRKCNPGGLDRHFLFMGDYVDRGPHSLEVVLLLLALKVEYPSLVFLTRGNHEEEKTSRVYGFLTEATSSLGAAAGTAVWSAVNKVFLDLPLAAIVKTPQMRFFVTHGGLSPCLHTVDEIAAVNRNRYSAGDITADQDDMVTGLLWSDPTNDVPMYRRNPRGCGFMFGPTASYNFCVENNVDFICRAHQVAMEGYIWTHNDRVVTVFSAPNYCGVNGNKGAVLIVNGHNRRPVLKQYESIETAAAAAAPGPRPVFPYSSLFT